MISPKPISVQLYTLRTAAQKNFLAVLKSVADMGYCGIEFAGLHGHSPAEIKNYIDDLGLRVSSSHTALPDAKSINEIADTELALGNTTVISGLGPNEFKTLDDCKQSAERFETAAQLAKQHGMRFGIHNHWWEFDLLDGKLIYDIVLAYAPSAFSELDVYWTAFAGFDPAKVVADHKARLPILHIKDGTLKKDVPHLAVGSGVLDMVSIIAAADDNVLEWLIVELDDCATDMTTAVRDSYNYLTTSGLAIGRSRA